MPSDSDTASPPAAPGPDAARAARMIPFIVGCALFMQMLDSTVVATALPAMAESLRTTPVRLNVAITSYLLAVAVFVPVSGWAADRFGARRVFVSAIWLFMVSSLACAVSQNLVQLLLARVAQGIAGAMMVPVGRIILLRIVPKRDLLKAMTFLSMPALLGPMIGPPLGGFLVTYASWHWIFLINLPIGLLGILMVRRYIGEFRDDTAPRLDWTGFLLSSLCLASLVVGFEAIGHQSLPASAIAALTVTGIVCALLYRAHAKRRERPILDLDLMKIRTFAISVLGGNLCRFAVGGVPFLLAMLLQVGFGLTPLAAGLITFASAVGSLLMKFVAQPILQGLGFRRVLIVNAVLTGAFVIACVIFTPLTPAWAMIVVLLLGGFFRSLQFTAVNTLTFADIPPEKMSSASSFSAMAQQLGISLGVAVAAVTLHLSMVARGATELETPDVLAGFVVIGALCMLSALSFRKLSPEDGAQLRRKEKTG